MLGSLAANDFVSSIVPISRFNKGEAGKVFSEVKESGFKVVLKNNVPTCILLSPAVYEEIKEILVDYRLLVEAEARMKQAHDDDFVTAEEAMKELGITETDLKTANTEIS